MELVVTVDLFSALLDSRRGGGEALARMARARRWDGVDPQSVFDCWDHENKRLHEERTQGSSWATFRQLAEQAMARACARLEVPTPPEEVTSTLLASIPEWPPWPDSVLGLRLLSEFAEVGVLSNVDTDILAGTAVAALVHRDHYYTSERWRAYKPAPTIYLRTQEAIQERGCSHVHVASSARDVRGATAAGIDMIHLRRIGIPQPAEGHDAPVVITSLVDAATHLRKGWGQPEHKRREHS